MIAQESDCRQMCTLRRGLTQHRQARLFDPSKEDSPLRSVRMTGLLGTSRYVPTPYPNLRKRP